MWKDKIFEPSPSRTYVAICNRTNFDGHYFRKFRLPERGETLGYQDENGKWVEESFTRIYPNTCSVASWYFLNKLNFSACIEACIPIEQYNDLKDQDDMNARVGDMIEDVVRNAPAAEEKEVSLLPMTDKGEILPVKLKLPSLAGFSTEMGKALLPASGKRKGKRS